MTLNDLKARAQSLGLSPSEVREHGALSNKGTWIAAIRQAEALNAEADEENRQAELEQIYKSPGAAVIVPVAFTAAVAHGLAHNVAGMLRGKG
jgi:hypothetical protein